MADWYYARSYVFGMEDKPADNDVDGIRETKNEVAESESSGLVNGRPDESDTLDRDGVEFTEAVAGSSLASVGAWSLWSGTGRRNDDEILCVPDT